MVKIDHSEGLKITIDTNLTITDFLDVTFDLKTGIYYPFRKPNDKPLYINANSNHPPTILKQLPKMINKRISGLSSNEEEFNKAKNIYEDALLQSGFEPKLTYEPNQDNSKKRKRCRNIIWFNPPYNNQVKTEIGKHFLKLVRKHFTKRNRLHKIFNTNTIKISYSCSPNITSIIKQHNAKILNESLQKISKPCNCRVKKNCPLDGKCLATSIVYKANVTTNYKNLSYYGACEGEFKTRYNNHTKSFRLRKYQNETELSKYIWKLKDNKTKFQISWSIEKRAAPYKCGTRRCDLCLSEKVAIVRANPNSILNKRTEFISKCRHRNKFIIGSVK